MLCHLKTRQPLRDRHCVQGGHIVIKTGMTFYSHENKSPLLIGSDGDVWILDVCKWQLEITFEDEVRL